MGDISILKSDWNMKKNYSVVSSRAFSLSTPVENSEATWKKSYKMQQIAVAICFSDPKYDLNSSIQEFPKNSSRFPRLFIFLWQMAKEFSKNLEEFQHEKVDGLKFSFNFT